MVISLRDLGLSKCHFAPVTRNEFVVPPGQEGEHYYCSYCGEIAEAVVIWPQAEARIDSEIELMIRRYKDGEAQYSDIRDLLISRVKSALNESLDEVTRALQPNEPVWKFSFDKKRWEKMQ